MPAKDTTKSKMSHRKALAILGVAATLAYAVPTLTALGQAHASGGGSGGGMKMGGGSGGSIGSVTDPKTQAACSECHMAYPANLLPATAWRTMMGNLSNHFGEDASIDPADIQHITAYLVNNAGRGNSTTLRITKQNWFVSEHRGEVSARSRERAKTMSNCVACHGAGKQGILGGLFGK